MRICGPINHPFVLSAGYDYLNIQIDAAAARWAILKGMPVLGTSQWGNPATGNAIEPFMTGDVELRLARSQARRERLL